MNPKRGVGVETEKSGAGVPVRWEMLKEREQDPRCWTIQSQAERRDRGLTEESWLLFEGIDTFLYDLMRKSKSKSSRFPKYYIFGPRRARGSMAPSSVAGCSHKSSNGHQKAGFLLLLSCA